MRLWEGRRLPGGGGYNKEGRKVSRSQSPRRINIRGTREESAEESEEGGFCACS